MTDEISFLKARYCWSIMRTANISSDDEARRLIACLGTETLTGGLSRSVMSAERNALATILKLSEQFQDRSRTAVATEWRAALDDIRVWIDAARS